MPDPARLPRELFEIILDHAIKAHRASYGSPDKRHDPALLPPGISKEIMDVVQQRRPDPRSEERLLFDLCCISRRWRQVVQPKLYETFTYRGELHSFRDLWLYVRTVLSNPSLAADVKHLHIRAWGKMTKSENHLTFSDAERDMLKTAIRDAGIDTKQETEIILGTIEEDADRRPLMAILLT